MRVDFAGPVQLATDPFGTRFGLGAYLKALRGLGECVSDGSCDTVPGQTTDNCGTLCAEAPPAPSGGCSSYPCSTPNDNEYVANCSQYDANANCVQCSSGFNLDNSGNYTACVAPGGVKPPAPGSTGFTNWLGSLFAPTPATNSAALCAAAHGTWNGTACVNVPAAGVAGSINIGGMVISTTTLLLIVGAFLLLKKK